MSEHLPRAHALRDGCLREAARARAVGHVAAQPALLLRDEVVAGIQEPREPEGTESLPYHPVHPSRSRTSTTAGPPERRLPSGMTRCQTATRSGMGMTSMNGLASSSQIERYASASSRSRRSTIRATHRQNWHPPL